MQKLLEGFRNLNLPEEPGVYFFLKDATPIYVGKAINLKRRVRSYFDLYLLPKTAKMVEMATSIDYISTTSELEALLLEAKLIRKYQPRYNSVAKDDKHPLYITITNDVYPRVITSRKTGNYGPFTSTRNVYFVLKMIRRIFPFSDHKIGKRACLYHHMGLCNPCPSTIKSEQDKNIYKNNIKHIRSILDGKIAALKKELEAEMKISAKNQLFENALKIRSKIEKLAYITTPTMPTDSYLENPNLAYDLRHNETEELSKILKSHITNVKSISRIECFDIAHLQGTSPTASMVTFIDGVAEKKYYRHFRIKISKGGNDYSSMAEVAKRRIEHLADWGIPDLIIVDGGVAQVKAFIKAIKDIPVVGIAKHPDRLIIGKLKIKLEASAHNLVSRIRDEAHRFARVYHHKLISKSMWYHK